MQQDALWKAIIEDLAEDLLRFFFPGYVDLIDFFRGFEFLDKELQQLFTDAETSARRADKLIKAWLKNGEEAWFLIHIEVQGYPDDQFALRMFQSAYRIFDKHGRPLVALVIYTDAKRSHHVNEYRTFFMETELIYRFKTFSLVDQSLEELAADENIFAAVLEAAAIEILHRGHDEDKIRLGLNLARRLLKKGWPRVKVDRILNFIRYSIRLDEEKSLNFGKEFEFITEHTGPMGIQELILEELSKKATEKGLEQGLEQGREQGRELEKKEIVLRGFQEGLPINVLARITGWPLEKVMEILEPFLNDHKG